MKVSKPLIILFLAFSLILLAESWKSADDIFDKYYPVTVSDSTTFEYSDVIYIFGPDSITWFTNQDKSLGNIWYHGTITSIDTVFDNGNDYGLSLTADTTAYGGAKDTLYIEVANHRGTGLAYASDDVFTALDTVIVDSAGTGNFSFYLKQDSGISAVPCEYYAVKLKLASSAGNAVSVAIKEEKIRQY